MKLFGLPPERFGFVAEFWNSSDNHSNKELGLSGFFLAGPDLVAKLLLRHGIVGFGVIRSDTRSGTNQLVNQSPSNRAEGDLLGKVDNGFTEFRGPLVKVVTRSLG